MSLLRAVRRSLVVTPVPVALAVGWVLEALKRREYMCTSVSHPPPRIDSVERARRETGLGAAEERRAATRPEEGRQKPVDRWIGSSTGSRFKGSALILSVPVKDLVS